MQDFVLQTFFGPIYEARCYSGRKSAAISAVHLLQWRNFRPAKKCCRSGNTNQGRPCPMWPYLCQGRAAL